MPRLLLVDDELHILKAAEFKLKRHGYEVACAFDGQDAWEKILEERPALLVTDYQMPRLSGLDLIERLRGYPEYADLPVILLTAKGYELSKDDTVNRYGVLEIMCKPFSPRDLCRRVELILGGQAARDDATAKNSTS